MIESLAVYTWFCLRQFCVIYYPFIKFLNFLSVQLIMRANLSVPITHDRWTKSIWTSIEFIIFVLISDAEKDGSEIWVVGWYLNAAKWELYFLFCSTELWGDHTTWSNIDFEKYFIIFTAPPASVGGIYPTYLHFTS